MLDYEKFCKESYEKVYNEQLICEHNSRVSETAAVTLACKLAAQRKAIDQTFVEALVKYGETVDEADIWKAIAFSHKLKSADLSKYGIPEEKHREVFEACLSAHQSWIKSSGHSFERYISSAENEELKKNEIRFILQSEMTKLIKGNKLVNTEDDIKGLNSWGKDFDLYAVQSVHGEEHIFGCIQSKTSIRDRVGRDVTFSHNAMDGLFWSVAVTLDGDFLNMQEFKNMVNGGGSYTQNGWHGMYAMSGIDKTDGRIYKDDDSLNLFIDHAVQAARQFISDRRMLDANWKAV